MSQKPPMPPDLPAPPGGAPATQPEPAAPQFELVEAILRERSSGQPSPTQQRCVSTPVTKLRAETETDESRKALEAFDLASMLLLALGQAKTDADPIQPI